jgi:hypothetical protein
MSTVGVWQSGPRGTINNYYGLFCSVYEEGISSKGIVKVVGEKPN